MSLFFLKIPSASAFCDFFNDGSQIYFINLILLIIVIYTLELTHLRGYHKPCLGAVQICCEILLCR